MTRPGENANQLDRAGIGSTAIERGDDNEHSLRSRL
jgi:hypothetical protein